MPKISYRVEDIAFGHLYLANGKTLYGGSKGDGKNEGPLQISVEDLAAARARLQPFTYRTWIGAGGQLFGDIFRDATPKEGFKDVSLLSLLTITDEPPPPPPPVAAAAASPDPEEPAPTSIAAPS